MSRISQWFLMAMATVLLAACASPAQVHTDYDRNANFAQYRTFGFFSTLGTDERGTYETLTTQHLEDAVRREMTARGYVYTQDNPDLLVNFSSRIQKRYDVDTLPEAPDPFFFPRERYGPWPGYVGATDIEAYSEGTLTIDLVDRASNRMVWEGVAAGLITEESRDIPAQNLDKVVTQIFSQYPFKAGSI